MTDSKYLLRDQFKKCRVEYEKQIRRIVERVASEIVTHTPVDSGKARGNWRLALEKIGQTRSYDTFDPDGDFTISVMNEMFVPFRLGQRVYIYNSVPYIFMLEHGYSQQAPGGILAVVARETMQYIEGGKM